MVSTPRKTRSLGKKSAPAPKPAAKASKPTQKTPSARTKSHEPAAAQATSRTADIEHTMQTLLAPRAMGSTICPSEIPRRLHDNDAARYPDWREMMDEVRDEVWRAVGRGEVEVTQRGEVRTVEERGGIKGPIRVRRGPNWKD